MNSLLGGYKAVSKKVYIKSKVSKTAGQHHLTLKVLVEEKCTTEDHSIACDI